MDLNNDSPIKSNEHVVQPQPKSPATRCPVCQYSSDANDKFCPQCGRRHEVSAVTPSDSVKEKLVSVNPPSKNIHRQDISPIAGKDRRPTTKEGMVSPDKADSDPDFHLCRCCGLKIPASHKFCYRCGTGTSSVKPEYQLKCMTQGDHIKMVPLVKDEMVIGKQEGCDLVIPGDEYISRRHVRLSISDGLIYLEDLDSANGTFLRVRKPIVLEPGNEILIGTAMIQLLENTKPV